jgi:hypothetical protein
VPFISSEPFRIYLCLYKYSKRIQSEVFHSITPEWKNAAVHVKKVADDYWNSDKCNKTTDEEGTTTASDTDTEKEALF